jgi:hypothetical protein
MTGSRHGRSFWVLAAIGWAVMVFGIVGTIVNENRTAPAEMAAWILGMALIHDLVLAPAVFAAGIAIRRSVSPRLRAGLQGALIATGVLVIYSFPLLRGYGRRPSNPTVQPNNYALGFAIVAATVWVVSGAALWWASRRNR